MSWQGLLKNWAYSADNVDEYLEHVRKGIDHELDFNGRTHFRRILQDKKKYYSEMRKENPEKWNKMKESMRNNAVYRFATNYFEEGHSLYESLVTKFGHYAARRARMPRDILRDMARIEHKLEILNLFDLEEPKKYTVDMMKDWYVTGHYDEDV